MTYVPDGNGAYNWGGSRNGQLHGRSSRRNPPPPKKKCCFAGEAVKAVWLGKFKLAARYARLDVKARLAGTY